MHTPVNESIRRILVVDDNPSIHGDFRKILCSGQSAAAKGLDSLEAELLDEAPPEGKRLSFEMDSALQGQEALEKVQAAEAQGRPYSLAFVDVRMPPGWDGIETISRIWKDHPAIQIIICTAYSDYSWEEIRRKLGETDNLAILKKPFDNMEVSQLAHTMTTKWVMTRQANARMADLSQMVQQSTYDLLKSNHELQDEINRRSASEYALRDSEQRFRKAFDSVLVPLSIRRAEDGRFLDVNQSFTALSGYPKAEILGKTPQELHLLVQPEQLERLLRLLAGGRSVRNAELTLRRRDGKTLQTLISIQVLDLAEQRCLLSSLLDAKGGIPAEVIDRVSTETPPAPRAQSPAF